MRGTVAGEFAIRSFVATASTARAIRLAQQALERLHRDGVSEQMLASARAYALGQYALGLETAADWAGALADLEFFGLGTEDIDEYPARLAEVDPTLATAVIAETFPRPESSTLVVIGDAQRISGQLAEFGPILTMRLTDPDFAPGATGDEARP
jgi:predicted Zn-dependent peptidase